MSEGAYLQIGESLLARTPVANRTNVPAARTCARTLEFDLRNGTLPLLTSKRVPYKSVVTELLFFLSGRTDVAALVRAGNPIWTANTTEDALRARGLDLVAGDLGPGYPFQWRHAGAGYLGKDVDYTGIGVDQVSRVIHDLQNDPNSRRIIINSWDVASIDRMALPPCHVMCQFLVEDGEIVCIMYQRSADWFLGVPFNIASYATLTHLLAHITGLKAGRLVMHFGDVHLYENHFDQMREQITRTPRPFPHLEIGDLFGGGPPALENIDFSDLGALAAHFKVVNYNPHPPIRAPMAV